MFFFSLIVEEDIYRMVQKGFKGMTFGKMAEQVEVMLIQICYILHSLSLMAKTWKYWFIFLMFMSYFSIANKGFLTSFKKVFL